MTNIDKLLVVQEHDLRIRDWEKELKDIPARKKQESERLQSHGESLASAEDALKACESAAKQLELDEASEEEKISKLRQQQMQLKTNEEFKAMEREIAAVQDSIRHLEEKQLLCMERAEGARAVVAEKKAALATEEALVAEDVKRFDERATAIERDCHAEQREREQAAAVVDPEWLRRYEILASRKLPALVSVSNGICDGCHMKLPPQVVNDAGKRLEMVFCDFCGRMLF